MSDSKVYDVILAFQEAYGFDPQGVYCQLTGKQIGSFLDSEFDALIESLGALDPEEMVDDIAIRLLASMRPSIRWNVMREESLKELREAEPVDTLAYLINRLFAPLGYRKLGVQALLADYEHRIKTHQLCSEWGVNDSTNTLLYMLLELDAKWSLDLEFPPFSWRDFFEAESMNHRIEMLQAWYERRVEAWDKKVKADAMQIKWSRTGHALAKPAFMAEYLAAKPLSKTAEKKQAKEEEKRFMAGILSEILMGRIDDAGEAEAVEPKPAFVPIRKMPMQFGVK